MKKQLPTWLCALIAAVLVIFGMLYGTYGGYARERTAATSLLTGENGLMDVLDYRGSDGLNLCVVAKRHLSADTDGLIRLEKSACVLKTSTDIAELSLACEAMREALKDVETSLAESTSFTASERDRNYWNMLCSDLNTLSGSAAVSNYNEAACSFNEKLYAPLSGFIARLLGMKELTVVEVGQIDET